MASLPFFVKLFSSCFTMNEDPLCRLRNASTHGCTRPGRTDSFSSFTDSESVVLASTSTMSWHQCEDECDSNRAAKESAIASTSRRHLHEMDVRPNQKKRLREDSSHLRNTLSVTDQEANCFANLTARDGEEPRRKRHHPSLHPPDEKRDMPISGHLVKRTGFKKAQALLSAKTKATLTLLRKELNYVKSQLNIAQTRCDLLQEENRWLRANMPAEEDSLLRREVEMLLANKSQLALDNAYLTRERERLLQLVGYFQTGLPSVDSD